MALITKQVLICNKCEKEAVGVTSNVTILGEEFYFCDECLERLLNWVSRKPMSDTEVVAVAKQFIAERESSTQTVIEKSHTPRSKSYVKWDDYNIDRLLSLREQGYGYDHCAKALGTTNASILSILHHIRDAKVGTEKYPYRQRLLDMGKVIGTRKKEGDN